MSRNPTPQPQQPGDMPTVPPGGCPTSERATADRCRADYQQAQAAKKAKNT